MINYCQLWLTCKDKQEADKIANALLDKHLVACARQWPVASDYRWKGKIKHDHEILLLMESRQDLFDEVEDQVNKFHSYETYLLEAVNVDNVSKQAKEWLGRELKDD